MSQRLRLVSLNQMIKVLSLVGPESRGVNPAHCLCLKCYSHTASGSGLALSAFGRKLAQRKKALTNILNNLSSATNNVYIETTDNTLSECNTALIETTDSTFSDGETTSNQHSAVYKYDESYENLDTSSNLSVKKEVVHVPVMVEEVLKFLQPKLGQVIVDMTFGGGGHAKEILKVAPEIHYIASDRDPFAHKKAVDLASTLSCGKLSPVLGRFSEILLHLKKLGIMPGQVDAFLFDLGTSSFQFDFPHRGFALSRDGPLDMRMDGNRYPDQPTAADVVNTLDVADLEHIISKYGEEKKSKEIAQAIVEARYAFGKFKRTQQLADVVKNVFCSDVFRQDKLSRPAHLATKTFQALRIFVNDELNEISNGLHVARHYLKDNGRCVVISFHSLEDRIAKRHFHDIDIDQAASVSLHHHFRNANVVLDEDIVKKEYLKKPWKPLSRKVVEPTDEECQKNPRARSAKLRAAIKL